MGHRCRVAWWVVIGLGMAGCGGAIAEQPRPPTLSSGKPPELRLIEVGAEWFCTHVDLEGLRGPASYCYREASQCHRARHNLTSVQTSECASQQTAYCYTVGVDPFAKCLASADDCAADLADAAQTGGEHLSACGEFGPTTTASQGPPPDEKLMPPGSGWYCYHVTSGGQNGACARTEQECGQMRAALEGSYSRPRCSACAPQGAAWCYTSMAVGSKITYPQCTPDAIVCESLRNMALGSPSDHAQVSTCAEWGDSAVAEAEQLEPAPEQPRMTGVPLEEPAEQLVGSEPPDPLFEEAPAAPNDDSLWIPGFWNWTGAEWTWVPGGFSPRVAGYSYVAPYYEIVGGNVVYVRGYWHRGPVPERHYGGVTIALRPAARPAAYRAGMRVVARPTPGLAVGSRPATLYGATRAATRPSAHLGPVARPRVAPPVYRAPPTRAGTRPRVPAAKPGAPAAVTHPSAARPATPAARPVVPAPRPQPPAPKPHVPAPKPAPVPPRVPHK